MKSGRPHSTSHDQIARVALELFAERGFEATTVEEIAAAVGVGRRTIFRYFPSKNDMVWGNFEWVLERLRTLLEESPPQEPLFAAVKRAALLSNRYPPEQLPELRIRMALITTVPALQAHSMLRYGAWRRVIAEFVAARLGCDGDDLGPQAISHAALGASMAGFGRWVAHPEEDLDRCLEDAYEMLGEGFAGLDGQAR
ncbi:MAG: mycofactocin system transcriptional regulator [Solirubrobacterales bacterium]